MNQKQKLQKIIDDNIDQANMGCSTAQGKIVMAQASLDDIAKLEATGRGWWVG